MKQFTIIYIKVHLVMFGGIKLSSSRAAVKSILIMIVFAFGSKLLGFFREVLIAAKFGSGVETDAFFVALTATTLVTTFLTKSINTTMIPILSEVESKEGKEKKINHTNNLLTIVLVISFCIVLIGWFIAPKFMAILAHGFEGEQFKMAIYLMRVGLPVTVFAGVVGVFRGYLQSEQMFNESALANYPINFVYIFYLIFLSNIFGIKGLMIASVIAVGAQIIIQIPGMKKTGYNYKFALDMKDKYVRKIMILVPPILISTAINDINMIIDRSLASTLITGSISALNYGNRLNDLILGIFITAITTVMFPTLSKNANKENLDEFKKTIRYGINAIVLIILPATVGMIILAEPIVRIAFERGAFDSQATYMTAGAMIFYSLGLLGTALRTLLIKIYYSFQDTRTPMITGFIAVGCNVVLNIILIRFMQHKGLALATSIAATVTTVLFLFILRQKIGQFGIIKIIKCVLKSLAASLIMGGIVYFAYYYFLESFVENSIILEIVMLSFSASLGAVIYFFIINLLKVEEIAWLLAIFKKRLKRTEH